MVAACADEVASKKASKDFFTVLFLCVLPPLSSQWAMIVRFRVNGIFLWVISILVLI
jgi:hypothetical protein